jgi:hypothetical protein
VRSDRDPIEGVGGAAPPTGRPDALNAETHRVLGRTEPSADRESRTIMFASGHETLAMALLPWFEALSLQAQLVLAAVVFDPIGFAAGYLFAPEFGVEPILGGAYGLVAASLPLSLLVLREASGA